MKNVLAIFIIAVAILSVTIPLNSAYAQEEVIGDMPDRTSGDDIIMDESTWVIVFVVSGMVFVFAGVWLYMRKRFGRSGPSIFKDK